MDKPVVAIFSSANFVALSLVESLLSKGVIILIFTNEKNEWQKKSSHIVSKSKFEIFDTKFLENFQKLNYAIFINGFSEKRESVKDFLKIYNNSIFTDTKTLAIFPIEEYDQRNFEGLTLQPNLALIFLSELLGPRISLNSNLRINSLLNESLAEHSVSFYVGETFNPIFITDLIKVLNQWIFSFGPYGRETLILGPEISAPNLWLEIKRVIPDLTISYNEKRFERQFPKEFDQKRTPSNIKTAVVETLRWLDQNNQKTVAIKKEKPAETEPIKSTEPVYVKEKEDTRPFPSPGKKNYFKFILIAILLLISPFFLTLLVGGSGYLAYRTYIKGNSEASRNLALFAQSVSAVGRGESKVFKYIPLLGSVYHENEVALDLFEKFTPVFMDATFLMDGAKTLLSKALGDEIYDPGSITSEMRLNLNSIYVDLSEAQTTLKNASETKVSKFVSQKINFDKTSNLLLESQDVIEQVSNILGKDDRKTYLVLFQNNMELRPTGGFIGSFGLLTFEGGRMTDFTLSDVYSADGQLKGHIEPPPPIKKYLGEANWFLRDSNWDPDFPTSALRAEWFLDKEIDRKVDGVIAVDLEPVKSLVEIMGPIYLSDYEMTVTSDNLYEKTQAEVHEEVFAGTHKKASFLTALSRNLINEMSDLNSTKKALVLKEFYQDLESRHIQVFLHEVQIQESLDKLGYSGQFLTPSCGQDCYPDFVGVVEANVGVNKANYFISRQQDLKVDILPDRIRRQLTLSIKNSANPGLGAPAKYKAYIRIVVPQQSEVVGDYEITEGKGRKEIGFLEEVTAGETKDIKIVWDSPKSGNINSYGLYFRKQAGTPDTDVLKVSVLAPEHEYRYNTPLDRDFLTKTKWTNTH